MGRTVTMTVAECEAAIGVARGELKWIDPPRHRQPMRKWLVGMGVPATIAYKSRYSEWISCYNDLTGEKLREMAGRPIPQDATPVVEDDNEQEESAMAGPSIETTTGIEPPAGTTEADALALLRKLLGNTVDEKQVRAIVQNELGATPIHRIEVKICDTSRILDSKPRHKIFEQTLQAVAQNIPVILCGPAGAGKSTLAEQVAEALELEFYIQGAATGTHEYLGFVDGAGQYHTTAFRQAFEFGGLFCADELDSGDAAVPLTLNAALANGHMGFPDSPKPIKRHPNFRMIGTTNTFGNGADRVYVGRTQLDGATINRFAFLTMDYDNALESIIAGNDAWVARVQKLRAAAREEKGCRIIISPRASIFGARMLAAGWTRFQCEEAFIWAGVDGELRRRIETRAN